MSHPSFSIPAKPVIAFGPEMAGFGSWVWIGADTAKALSGDFTTLVFSEKVPACDVVVFVKFKPPSDVIEKIARHSAVVYCPVDFYSRAAEIDADFRALGHCSRIVIHCERLRRYFSTYGQVEFLDHHLKYNAPLRESFKDAGPVLWVGVRSNLSPLVHWVNHHRLPTELWILTNPEDGSAPLRQADYGFNMNNTVRIGIWNAERHRDWTELARAAIDIKGGDFRSRHKPPTKAMDFLASGVPFATNADSSPAEHLMKLGCNVASPEDQDRWFSREYWNETVRFSRILSTDLSCERIAARWKALLRNVLDERFENIR